MSGRWQTSNAAYGAGVVADQRRRVDDQRQAEVRYGELAAVARRDRDLAAAVQDSASKVPQQTPREMARLLALAPPSRSAATRLPSAEAIALGAQRLQQRLSGLGLKEKAIRPDGACQFRAVEWGV